MCDDDVVPMLFTEQPTPKLEADVLRHWLSCLWKDELPPIAILCDDDIWNATIFRAMPRLEVEENVLWILCDGFWRPFLNEALVIVWIVEF